MQQLVGPSSVSSHYQALFAARDRGLLRVLMPVCRSSALALALGLFTALAWHPRLSPSVTSANQQCTPYTMCLSPQAKKREDELREQEVSAQSPLSLQMPVARQGYGMINRRLPAHDVATPRPSVQGLPTIP